ncbi:hypothetical protein [Paenibacillus daejeonensis]|uniref:hypothetical protein n=1 Tax=Paenibacillus daejeonensis TaxID=135193 RepID=UPI00036E376C|nr:hypothetical protein [Paenibacillus daejeonensis]
MAGAKKKLMVGCLAVPAALFGLMVIIVVVGSILGGDDSEVATTTGGAASGNSTTEQTAAATGDKSNEHEAFFTDAQALNAEGKYIAAMATIDKAIAAESKEEYTTLRTELEGKIASRKSELESSLEIKEDKVENITFISPKSPINQGLIFYPYIGIKDSKKYMLLRVGFQEDPSKALFVFTGIKVRAGDTLEELKFSPLDKMNNVDFFGSGMTEAVDIQVRDKEESLLASTIPGVEEVIVRFEDISNKSNDYTLTDGHRKNIADILEYYSYLE